MAENQNQRPEVSKLPGSGASSGKSSAFKAGSLKRDTDVQASVSTLPGAGQNKGKHSAYVGSSSGTPRPSRPNFSGKATGSSVPMNRRGRKG